MAKRSNGAGSVKRLPSGTWRGQLMDGFHDNGKRRIVNFTAPTKAELLALKSEDIAEDGSSARIAKAIKMIDGCPALGAPKSAKGRRIVPIPQKYRKDALYLRAHGNDGFIWTSQRENKLYDVGVFRKKYYRILKSIPGVRRLSPHCCRHTYISRLEARGVPMEQIARLVGHARITVTDGYLHTSAETLAEAAATLDVGKPKISKIQPFVRLDFSLYSTLRAVVFCCDCYPFLILITTIPLEVYAY